MATGFDLNYMINVQLKQQDGFNQLLNQLTQLQRIAKQGADFAVRIDSGALAGIEKAVSKAVKNGVRNSGREMPDTSQSSNVPIQPAMRDTVVGRRPANGATDLSGLIVEIGRLRTSIGHLVGKIQGGGAQQGGTIYSPKGDPVTTGYITSTASDPRMQPEMNRLRTRLGDMERDRNALKERLARLEQALEAPSHTVSSAHQFNAAADKAIQLGRTVGHDNIETEVAAIRKVYEENAGHVGGKTAERERNMNDAMKKIGALMSKFITKADTERRDAEIQLDEATKTIEKLQQELRVDSNQSERQMVNRVTRNPVGTNTSGGGGYGMAIDMSSVEASFMTIADKFGARLLSMLGTAPADGGESVAGMREQIREADKKKAGRQAQLERRHAYAADPEGLNLPTGGHEALYDSARSGMLFVPGGVDRLGLRKQSQSDFFKDILERRAREKAEIANLMSVDDEGKISGVSNPAVWKINAMDNVSARQTAAMSYMDRAKREELEAKAGLQRFSEYYDPKNITDPVIRAQRQNELAESPDGVRLPREYAEELHGMMIQAKEISRDVRRELKANPNSSNPFKGDQLERWNLLLQDPVMSRILEADVNEKAMSRNLDRVSTAMRPVGSYLEMTQKWSPELQELPWFHPSKAEGNPVLARRKEEAHLQGFEFAHLSRGKRAELENEVAALNKAMEETVQIRQRVKGKDANGQPIYEQYEYKTKTSAAERLKIQEQLDPLLQTLDMDGRWYNKMAESGNRRAFALSGEGLWSTPDELRMLNDKKISRVQAADAIVDHALANNQKPVWGMSGQYGGLTDFRADAGGNGNSIQRAANEIGGMVKNLQELNKLDLSNLINTFNALGASIGTMVQKLEPLKGQFGAMMQSESELTYAKKKNEEVERHLAKINELRGAGKAVVRQERAQARAKRELDALLVMDIIKGGVGTVGQDPKAIAEDVKSLFKGLVRDEKTQRTLKHRIQRATDANDPATSMKDRMLQLTHNMEADTGVLAQQALRLGLAEPGKFGFLQDPARATLEGLDRVSLFRSVREKTSHLASLIDQGGPMADERQKYGADTAKERYRDQVATAREDSMKMIPQLFDLADKSTPEKADAANKLQDRVSSLIDGFFGKATDAEIMAEGKKMAEKVFPQMKADAAKKIAELYPKGRLDEINEALSFGKNTKAELEGKKKQLASMMAVPQGQRNVEAQLKLQEEIQQLEKKNKRYTQDAHNNAKKELERFNRLKSIAEASEAPEADVRKLGQEAMTRRLRARRGNIGHELFTLAPEMQAMGLPVSGSNTVDATGKSNYGVQINMEEVGKRAAGANAEVKKLREGLMTTIGNKFMRTMSGDNVLGFLDKFGQKLSSLSYYMMAGSVLYTGLNMLRTGFREARMFEKDMADIQGVFLNKTKAEREEIQRGVLDTGYQFGVPLSQIAGTAKIFAQTGASPVKTMEMTRAAMMGTVGAGMDPNQATEMLIAVDNITQGRVSSTDIIDRISRIEARNAVTAQDLSVAVQRVGSVMQQLQPQQLGTIDALDTVIGASTAIIEGTRVSGNQAATSLRFMVSRLAAPDVAKRLQGDFGISLAENKEGTTLRPLQDILGDIAAKYQEYMGSGDSIKANQLLTSFAGARQVNAAAALFTNWDKVMDTAQESSLAFGDAQRRLAIQMDTLNSRMERLGNAWTEFFVALMEKTPLGSVVKGGVSGMAAILHAGAGSTGGAIMGAGLGGLALGGMGFLGGKALGVVGAGGALGGMGLGSIGAGLTSLAPVVIALGGLAATLGLGIVAFRKATETEESRRRLRDKFGPSDITMDEVKKMDFYKQFENQAGTYGFTATGMQSVVAESMQFAREKAAAELGIAPEDMKNYFSGKGSKTNPGLARAVERNFVDAMEQSVPGLLEITDEAQRTAEALKLFKESLKIGSSAAAIEGSKFQEDANKFKDWLREQIIFGGSKIVPDNVVLVDKFTTTSKYDAGLGTMVNARTAGERRPQDLAFGWKPGMSQNAGRNVNADALMAMAGALRGGDFAAAVGGMKYRDVKSGGLTYELRTAAAARAQQDNTTLGHALDSIANESFNLTAPMRELYNKFGKGANIMDKLNTAIDELSKQTGPLADSTKNVLMNQRELAKRMLAPMTSRLMLDARLKKTGEMVGDLSQSGMTAGGSSFGETLLRAYEINLPEIQKAFRKAGMTEEAKALEADAIALQNTENRGRFVGVVNSGMNKKIGKQYTKDRLLEAFLRYSEQEYTGQAVSTMFRGAGGIGYDLQAERYQNAEQLVRSLAAAEPQTWVDYAKAYDKSKSTTFTQLQAGITSAASGELGGDGERLALSASAYSAAQAQYDEMTATEKKKLEDQASAVKSALEQFRSNEDLMNTLSPELRAWIADAFKATGLRQQIMMSMSYGAAQAIAQDNLQRTNDVMFLRDQERSRIGESYTTASSASRFQYGLRGLSTATAVRRAELMRDPVSAMQLQAGAIGDTRSGALEQARLSYNRDLSGKLLELKEKNQLGTKYETEARRVLTEAYKAATTDAYNESVMSLTQLLNQAEEQYMQRRQAGVDAMVQSSLSGVSGTLQDLLADPWKTINHGPFDKIATSFAGTITERLSTSLVDNLLGPNGIFGEAFGKIFDQAAFLEAETIKLAHVEGIRMGFLGVYGTAAGSTAVGPGGMSSAVAGGLGVAGGIGALVGGGDATMNLTTDKDGNLVYAAAGMAGAGMGLHGMLDEKALGMDVAKIEQQKAVKKLRRDALKQQAAMMAGTMGGAALGKATGIRDGQNYGSEGAALGSMIGSFAGPVGTIVGGLLGGLLGGRVGKAKQDEQRENNALEKIERNTRETATLISNQLQMMSLDSRFLNVPSGFTVPWYNPLPSDFGASSGKASNDSYEVNIYPQPNQSADEIADAVVRKLQGGLRTGGTFATKAF